MLRYLQEAGRRKTEMARNEALYCVLYRSKETEQVRPTLKSEAKDIVT